MTWSHGLKPEVGQVHLHLSTVTCCSPNPANADSQAPNGRDSAAPLPEMSKAVPLNQKVQTAGLEAGRCYPTQPTRPLGGPRHTHIRQTPKELLTESPLCGVDLIKF